jgi:16S rRNA (guanine(1405)-N(7))-methyltransferase
VQRVRVSDLDSVVSMVAATKKYRGLCEDTIRRVAQRELAGGQGISIKAWAKATKRRLHQIYGAFEEDVDYAAAYVRLESAYRAGPEREYLEACRHALALHQSTRERLGLLDRFYPALWEITGQPESILDLGCGLNPLSIPWMQLRPECRYIALDIDRERVGFLNRYLAMVGMEPLARCEDIVAPSPDDRADVALLLKTSPTLERQEPGATGRLVERLRASWVVVSFAVRSLSGRDKGMAVTYERQFLEQAQGWGRPIARLGFETELVFVVECTTGRVEND